jgi:hypothetical protein
VSGKMKVIILGSSGMVGQGLLLECIENKRITDILLVNRNPGNIKYEKVKEIVHRDFFDFSSIKDQLKGYDACFFCLGISSAGMNEEQYSKITYELTLSFAHTLAEVNPSAVFCYISGAGTDSTGKGSRMWARVKGKTENDLVKLFPKAYMFRPGYIQPMKGIRSKTPAYNAFYVVFKPLYFLLRTFKGFVTDSVSLGKAMINAAAIGYEKKIIESRDINVLAKK